MSQPYWHKQANQPLFPDLLWARPETKQTAGKLLIVGGNTHSFAAPAAAFAAANTAGIGTCRVIMPDALRKTLRTVFPEAEYAPSTPSGSFARSSLAELLDAASWADGVIIAGDSSKNSETTALYETFLAKYHGLLTLAEDAVDVAVQHRDALLSRQATVLIPTLAQLQMLASQLRLPYTFTSSTNLTHYVEYLHSLTTEFPNLLIMTRHEAIWLVASKGKVSSTPVKSNHLSDIHVAATAATWWLQNPTQPHAALTTSLVAAEASQ